MKGTYYRWTRDAHVPVELHADILGADTNITVNTSSGGLISASLPERGMSPDEARMVGVRLIEAATLAGSSDAIRER